MQGTLGSSLITSTAALAAEKSSYQQRWPHFRTLGRTHTHAPAKLILSLLAERRKCSESGARTPPSINTNAVGCLFVQAAFPALSVHAGERNTHTDGAHLIQFACIREAVASAASDG
jgi:hypothetical protein